MTPERLAEIKRPVMQGPQATWTLREQKRDLLAEVQRLTKERDRAREYAEHLTGSANRAYAKAGRELLAILDGGERS